MKGTVKGNTIELAEKMPSSLQEGKEVEVIILSQLQEEYPYPIYDLAVKDEFIRRENIYDR